MIKPPICNKCKIPMKEGMALKNGLTAGMPDFPGDTPFSAGQTVSEDSLYVTLIPCWKCPVCGKSLTTKVAT